MSIQHQATHGPMVWRIINGLHRYLCAFIRFIIVLFRGERGQSMPPIDDRLLLESATSIAEKIRTKQVNKANRSKCLFSVEVSNFF